MTNRQMTETKIEAHVVYHHGNIMNHRFGSRRYLESIFLAAALETKPSSQ